MNIIQEAAREVGIPIAYVAIDENLRDVMPVAETITSDQIY